MIGCHLGPPTDVGAAGSSAGTHVMSVYVYWELLRAGDSGAWIAAVAAWARKC